MIIINFTSGLGNQLFQYFFGESLKINLKDQEIVYLNSLMPPEQIKIWDIFKVDIQEISQKDVKTFNFFIKKNKYLFINFVKLIIKFNMNINSNIFSDNNYKIDSKIYFDKMKSYFFYGYWQNNKFFNKNFIEIKNQFSFKKKLSLNLLDESLQDFDQIIGVHIRGGDYLKIKNKKIFYPIDENYYINHIKYFQSLFKNPIFLFFTDDITHLKKLLPVMQFNHKFIFDLCSDRNDDFQYLSLCNHFIIPNSSFSLWASYFSENKNKIIMKPENWFKESYTEKYKTDNYFKDNIN
ncbi:alpha-1,2-fucosyltransferase [Alphaproteobacteria bacterium]|nr:alpha-1,2-fucosyltransferase [Alphaproteobacteria bacterium]